jgi:hypothetical protein
MKTLSILILLISLQVYGQSQFQRTIGGNMEEVSFSIIQSTDGGYAIVGYSQTYSSPYDVYIVKLNANGLLQWTRNIGGTGDDFGYNIIQTSDGGYAIAGQTNSFGAGVSDMYIVKLDSSGTLQWNKTIGGTASDYANCIIQTSDGGYAVAGQTNSFGAGNSDIFLVRFNSNGSIKWSKTVGGTGVDKASKIIKTFDGGFAISGSTSSFGSGLDDMYIVKLDSGGTVLWNHTAGGSNFEYGTSILQCTDSSYVLAGETQSFGAGLYDMYLVKFDKNGNSIWNKTIGGTTEEDCSAITQTTDGGYALAGYINSAPYYGSFVKLNSGGNVQWVKRTLNETYSIVQTTEGGYALTGPITGYGAGSSDFCIIKFDAGGYTCGSVLTPTFSIGSGGTVTTPVPQVNSTAPTVTTPSPTSGTGGIFMSMCGVTGNETNANEIPKEFLLMQNYPNPFNPISNIKYQISKFASANLKVYDVLGKEVVTLVNEQLKPGTYEAKFDGTNYPSGVYYYKLSINSPDGTTSSGMNNQPPIDYSETKRMILIK